MADEPRRSGRATKGQHTKDRDLDDTPAPKGKKGKGKKAELDEADQPGPDGVLCICGAKEDDEGLKMIACEDCGNWEHNLCLGVTEDDDELETFQFYCERCHPQDYPALLAAKERGEKPWDEKKHQREAEEKAAKRAKKGKKGRAGGRPSKGADVSSTPAEGTPQAEPVAKQEAGSKRKHGENGTQEQVGELKQEIPTPAEDTPLQQKRRKSSHHASLTPSIERRQSAAQRKVSLAGTMAENNTEITGQRRNVINALSKDIEPIVKSAVKDKWFRVPDGHMPGTFSAQIAANIEGALAMELDEKAYADQFRRLHANIKNNHKLFGGLLTGKLNPDELAYMSSEEMATEERQQEMAEMKAAADKQSILIREDGPRMRKTHKGDELIDDSSTIKQSDDTFRPVRHRPQEDTEMPDAEAAAERPEVPELPEDVGHRPLTVDTASGAPPPPAHVRHSSSSQFDINQVWSSVQSPDNEAGRRPLPHGPHRRSSTMDQAHHDPSAPPSSAIVDADVDRLLKDDDPTDGYDGQVVNADWSGAFRMTHVGELKGSAKHIAGALVPPRFTWGQLLPQTIEVTGRIPIDITDTYIRNMRNQHHAEVSVLALTPKPTSQDVEVFNSIFNYFMSRNKWGVLSTHHFEAVKDMYLFPLEAGSAPFPSFLQILKDNDVPKEREGRMLLVVMVVKTATPTPSAQPTPQTSAAMPAAAPSGPSGPQGTPGQPQFSPVAPQAPFVGAQHNSETVDIPPRAAEILGDFIYTPTVMMMIANIPEMSELQLTNLKEVLDTAPETRQNIGLLSQHLMQRNGTQ